MAAGFLRTFPLALLAAVVAASTAFSVSASAQETPAPTDPAVIARGEYLAHAGDCVSCHTGPEGKLFAGGHAMNTPFGTIYTTNITPDPEYGIGAWSADQFYHALYTGRAPDGGLYYPAMPFGSFTKITRSDSDAIFAYLRSVPAANTPNRLDDLRFPFNNRSLILGWRTLYFSEGEYKPDVSKSEEWNRGAYLVQGLGHCAMCHTAINSLGGSSESEAFQGGLIPLQNWYAPSLTSNKEAGLGDWSLADISDLLHSGVSARGAVYGPMAEVVYNSLQYLSDADIKAMSVYLKGLTEGSPPPAALSQIPGSESSLLMSLGKSVYDSRCASCHGRDGAGKPPAYPPLAGNQSIQMSSAVNAIRMVLIGGFPPGTELDPAPVGMPPFAQTLSDNDVAAVVSYIRTSWGNRGAAVTATEANALRSASED